MILVLAEKAEVAKAISDALPGTGTKSGSQITQGDYLITWLSGHILTLKAPEDYDPALKQWSFDLLPINFNNWDTKPLDDEWKKKQFENIKNLLQKCDYVIHAGDPDQEGQLLVDEVLNKVNYTGPVKRLDTSDTTVKGLQTALAHMGDNKDFLSRGESAYARSVADFLIGINMSRLFTCLNPGHLLTFGRVQTPTLGLVVSRDMQIEGHQKVHYYTISVPIMPLTPQAEKKTITGKYEPRETDPILTDGKILDKQAAQARAKELSNQRFDNVTVEKKIVKENPPLPFNLVKLQSHCSKKFGYNLEQTLNATQELRDKFSAITYNRSAFQYLNDNHYAEAPATMATVTQNIKFSPKGLDMTLKSAAFNNKLYGEHPAIIPQNTKLDLTQMTTVQKNVYLAICQFYIAQFLPPVTKEVTRMTINLGEKGKIVATSTKVLDIGYLAIFRDNKSEEKETILSAITDKTVDVMTFDADAEAKDTKPPARYTQASLAEDMTCISKYVTDPRIKQIMKDKDKGSKEDNGSIGTVATRTPIIKNLISNGFLEDDGKHVISTPLGRELFRILPTEIKGVNVTAEWWLICEDIVNGKAKSEDLQVQVLQTIKDIIAKKDEYPKIDASIVPRRANAEVGKCPKCGNPVIENKYGFGCRTQGCGFMLWSHSKNPVFRDITLTANHAEKLLDGKPIHLKRLYSQKKDTHFEGDVYLEMDETSQSGYKMRIEFTSTPSEAAESLGACPLCGKPVTEFSLGYSCNQKEGGCGFVIWKKQKGNVFKDETITKFDVRHLLDGDIVTKNNLYSAEKNKSFTAGIKINIEKTKAYNNTCCFDLVFGSDKSNGISGEAAAKAASGSTTRAAPSRKAVERKNPVRTAFKR